LADVTAIFHEDFDVFGGGTINDPIGIIDDLGGGSLSRDLGVPPAFARLAYVEVLATDIGAVSYSLAPGSLRFSLFGMDNVEFDRVDLSNMLSVRHVPSPSSVAAFVSRFGRSGPL
jgi:hypothetical protein